MRCQLTDFLINKIRKRIINGPPIKNGVLDVYGKAISVVVTECSPSGATLQICILDEYNRTLVSTPERRLDKDMEFRICDIHEAFKLNVGDA